MKVDHSDHESREIMMIGQDESELKRMVQEGIDSGNVVGALFTGDKESGFKAIVTLTNPIKYRVQSFKWSGN